jgi:hypothetical protein
MSSHLLTAASGRRPGCAGRSVGGVVCASRLECNVGNLKTSLAPEIGHGPGEHRDLCRSFLAGLASLRVPDNGGSQMRDFPVQIYSRELPRAKED